MTENTQPIDLLDMDIESILSFFIGLTSTKALEYLGVSVKEDKEAEKDLEKARLSIDVTSFLADKLAPFMDDEEQKQLKQIVSNLQYAFIQESS